MAERTSIHTREQTLGVSSRLFTERGYRATSTRDIAEGVGIRQPSLFHHFSSKAEIMAELQRVAGSPHRGRLPRDSFLSHSVSRVPVHEMAFM